LMGIEIGRWVEPMAILQLLTRPQIRTQGNWMGILSLFMLPIFHVIHWCFGIRTYFIRHTYATIWFWCILTLKLVTYTISRHATFHQNEKKNFGKRHGV
jgi:hypothetical protein